MKLLLSSLVAILVCSAAMPADAAATTVTLRYKGSALLGAGTVEEECSGDLPRSLGVVCLDVPADASFLEMQVKDASRTWVGGSYYLYDASGELVGMGAHCGEAGIAVPAGGLVVVRIEAVNGPLACMAEGKHGAGEGTRGVVTFVVS